MVVVELAGRGMATPRPAHCQVGALGAAFNTRGSGSGSTATTVGNGEGGGVESSVVVTKFCCLLWVQVKYFLGPLSKGWTCVCVKTNYACCSRLKEGVDACTCQKFKSIF